MDPGKLLGLKFFDRTASFSFIFCFMKLSRFLLFTVVKKNKNKGVGKETNLKRFQEHFQLCSTLKNNQKEPLVRWCKRDDTKQTEERGREGRQKADFQLNISTHHIDKPR